jgi:ferrochelatase
MSAFLPEPPLNPDQPDRTGVLLINLGTPEAPTAAALRPYLKEFLSDRRVVELPRALWWLILNGFILPFRPARSAEKYAAIWREGGSPLKVYTERITWLLREQLAGTLPSPAGGGGAGGEGTFTSAQDKTLVDYAMTYGQPSVESVVMRMKAEGCTRLLVVPLYPQYAASSTGSALDAVYRTLLKTRNMPELRTVRDYHAHPAYIAALKQSIEAHWATHGRPDCLLMSFHGTPRRSLDLGDPYRRECLETGHRLGEALGLDAAQYRITFQSRFGKAEWLQPYTADILTELGQQKTGRLDVVCPGFAADCLETLEEIAIEGKTTFLTAGGGEFRYIPALNDEPEWVAALAEIVGEQLAGWI